MILEVQLDVLSIVATNEHNDSSSLICLRIKVPNAAVRDTILINCLRKLFS